MQKLSFLFLGFSSRMCDSSHKKDKNLREKIVSASGK